jgi:hypothetical protein
MFEVMAKLVGSNLAIIVFKAITSFVYKYVQS